MFVHHFEFSLKTADLEVRQLLYFNLPQGEDLAPFFLQEIHKFSTYKTLWNMEERPI